MTAKIICLRCLKETDCFINKIENNKTIRVGCSNCSEKFQINFNFQKINIPTLSTENIEENKNIEIKDSQTT